jgi:hypothetical protein
MQKTYTDGLNDAWELIKKIFSFNRTERKKAFGCEEIRTVVDCFTIKEAFNMLEAYEEEKAAINVGDVVKGIGVNVEGVIVKIKEPYCYILFCDGSAGRHEKSDFVKTGKHIEIQKILEQIAGD